MRHFPPHPLLHALPAATALLLAAVAPAPAAAPRDGLPGDWVRLTVSGGGPRSAGTRGTLLLCDPPRGHSRAAEACADLDAARGDIRSIPARDGICSLVYAPVTAAAHGRWKGRPVTYSEDFANACVMQAETGAVFALDEERPPGLAGLPPALPNPAERSGD
ncbi:SSI family serine proteinase inhibitor [Streptomyces sp. NPDC003247]|uniref:SSI family serine proteinase inhibitor n=1 Tax=Streptomyces sp. NPDC003247 TaxID=3364677 RepID=UPI0036B863EB